MIKLVYCFGRRPDLSAEEFGRYLREVHRPIALRIPGLRRLVQSVAFHDARDAHGPAFDGMAELRRQARVRIAGGEMARELHDLTQLIERTCLDVLQPDVVLVGGITGLARIGRMAQRRGLAFTPHTWGNGLGLMANAQLVGGIGGCPYLEFPYDPAGWTTDRRDFMLRAPLAIDRDGWLTLPDKPGLGVELDEDRLAETALVPQPPGADRPKPRPRQGGRLPPAGRD